MPAREKFRKAVARLDSYGAPSDESPLMVDGEESLFELLDMCEEEDGFEMEGAKQLTLGDLRQLLAETKPQQ